MTTLCLGEAIVDLMCEAPVDDLGEAQAFVPHFGGATANVAVIAARGGARIALAGGAGDDPWGRWLRDRLAAEGVDVSHFRLLAEQETPVAFVTVDGEGEPTYLIYGRGIGTAVGSLEDVIDDAVADAGSLFYGTNSLVGERERAVTERARAAALERGLPVVFDPNFRLHRWDAPARAVEEARGHLDGTFLVRCNFEEGRLLTGELEVGRQADGLLAAGARHVVITSGKDGAILRGGGLRLDVPGVPATAVSAVGAGDVLTGVLLARLATTDFYPAAIAAGLMDAVGAAARATERWGALPPAGPAS